MVARSTRSTLWCVVSKWWQTVRELSPATMAGLGLIVGGIVSSGLSDEVAKGWWQGTLQALGVGLVVGGLVDVLAISKQPDQR